MTQEGFSLPNGLAARRFGFGKIDRLGEFFSILPSYFVRAKNLIFVKSFLHYSMICPIHVDRILQFYVS